MSTPKGWELPPDKIPPKKPELTVEDLLAEVRAPRPWEEGDLETPILAERTAGMVVNITEKPSAESTPGESYDNMRKHKNNIRSLITQGEISFYTFDPITKKLTPIKWL